METERQALPIQPLQECPPTYALRATLIEALANVPSATLVRLRVELTIAAEGHEPRCLIEALFAATDRR